MSCLHDLLLVTALCCLQVVHAELKLHVPSTEFNSIISANELVMAAFVSEANDASKFLTAEYELAASALDQQLVTVDCATEKALCLDQDVSAYPAIRVYKGSLNQSIRYRGARAAKSIVSFLTKQSLPNVSPVTETNLTSFKQLDDTVFVAYLDSTDTESISLYTQIAQAFHEDFVFGLSTSPSLAKIESIEPPAVVSYQNTNGQSSALTGTFDSTTIIDFVHSSGTALIGQLTRRNMDTYLSFRKPILYLFLPRQSSSLNPTPNDNLLRALGPMAKNYGPYVSFVHVDAVEYAHMAPMLELQPDVWPAVVMHDIIRDRVWVYPQDDEVEADKIEALVLGVLKGEIEPTPPGTGRERSEKESKGGSSGHDEL